MNLIILNYGLLSDLLNLVNFLPNFENNLKNKNPIKSIRCKMILDHNLYRNVYL